MNNRAKQIRKAMSDNVRAASKVLGRLDRSYLKTLKWLTGRFGFSFPAGEIMLLDRKWYVTHAGLLSLAHRRGCSGIRTQLVRELSDPSGSRWVFKATVYKGRQSKGFVGFGDADPSNTSSLVHGAEMRVAETRAVNRALRKAYGIGLCSVEELGSNRVLEQGSRQDTVIETGNSRASGTGQPCLRDRLCQLIRQHKLDPTLVKRYAADFCGTASLREAGRELVEDFVRNLSEWATRDREGLVCHLNGFQREGKQP